MEEMEKAMKDVRGIEEVDRNEREMEGWQIEKAEKGETGWRRKEGRIEEDEEEIKEKDRVKRKKYKRRIIYKKKRKKKR